MGASCSRRGIDPDTAHSFGILPRETNDKVSGMYLCKRRSVVAAFQCATLLAGFSFLTAGPVAAEDPGSPKSAVSAAAGQWNSRGAAPDCLPGVLGSPYIPVDSWVYPAMLRLYSLGFVDNVFLGMRPWTRASVGHMIEEAGARIEDADAGPATDEAQGIYDALMHELRSDMTGPCLALRANSHIESVYTVARGISGTPLRDSYHLGSTIINDYGRPYENGFNNYSGASGYAAAGRFVFYVRGEFQAAPSAAGYSTTLAQALSTMDATIYPATLPTDYFLPPGHHPHGTDRRHHQWAGHGGLRLRPRPQPRNLLRQAG